MIYAICLLGTFDQITILSRLLVYSLRDFSSHFRLLEVQVCKAKARPKLLMQRRPPITQELQGCTGGCDTFLILPSLIISCGEVRLGQGILRRQRRGLEVCFDRYEELTKPTA